MKKKFYLLLLTGILFSTNQVSGLPNNSFFIKIMDRSIEVRYIVEHPLEQLNIRVDGKEYPVFNSKKEAIEYVDNLPFKYDLVIVYVRSEELKETETIILNY